jgi:hypothetical protein
MVFVYIFGLMCTVAVIEAIVNSEVAKAIAARIKHGKTPLSYTEIIRSIDADPTLQKRILEIFPRDKTNG